MSAAALAVSDPIWSAIEEASAAFGHGPAAAGSDQPQPTSPGLRDFLAVGAWAARELPAAEPLLGDLITRTTRTFLVGATGLGKTMFGLALAHGMAAGTGFLHWRSVRPARVLYLDGEMASELIKTRAADALRRAERAPESGSLTIYARDFEEQIARAYPEIGRMFALNTAQGHQFVYNLIDALGGVDVVIFDNVMSLLDGDMRDETAWSDTLPLIARLSEKRIGQVWFDHTGHDRSRQYGASGKAWRFDAVGMMTPMANDRSRPHDLAFRLSFDAPAGKGRRRTPDNWRDFQPCTIRLAEDRWTSQPTTAGGATEGQHAGSNTAGYVSPTAEALHRCIVGVIAASPIPGRTTRNAIRAEGIRQGLLAAPCDTDDHAERERKAAKLRKNLAELNRAGRIGLSGEDVALAA